MDSSSPIFEEPPQVELLTLQTERLLHGGAETDERFFDSLESAVRWAESMSADKQAESWICAGSEKLSIPQARERVEREYKQNITAEGDASVRRQTEEREVSAAVSTRNTNFGANMTQARDLFVTGLKNAHAMENQAHEMLERQVDRMTDYPELRDRLSAHLQETKSQLKRLEQCLSEFGTAPSTMKDATMAFGANMAAMAHAMASDEVLKNTFANSGLEAYEIAAYKSLLKMAETVDRSAIEPLMLSLREEEQMAQWVASNVDRITTEYMRKEEKAAA